METVKKYPITLLVIRELGWIENWVVVEFASSLLLDRAMMALSVYMYIIIAPYHK